MKRYNILKNECYRIKDKFLYKVFTTFGIYELHKIMFFLIHNNEFYYFGIRLDESWFYGLNADEQILLLDIYNFYEEKKII